MTELTDVTLWDTGEVVGSSMLTRTASGISVEVETAQLVPGTYTLWWSIYNQPEGCGDVCGDEEADWTTAPTDYAWGLAAGEIVNSNGTARFLSKLAVDEALSEDGALHDPLGSAVELIIRYHGQPEQGRVYQQTHEYEEGLACDIDANCDRLGGATGDHQYAMHAAPDVQPDPSPGDVNGDGRFNNFDIVEILQAGKYGTGDPAEFGEGDFNGDGIFDQFDLILSLQNGNYEQVEVLDLAFLGTGEVVGSTSLTRTTNGLSIDVQATELLPGTYTLWWSVYNDQSGCVDICGHHEADWTTGPTDYGWGWAAGAVVDDSGTARFISTVGVGDTFTEDGTLSDPMHSAVEVLTRYHGPVDASRVWEQTHTPEEGLQCDHNPDCDRTAGDGGVHHYALHQ